jgi:hypothetical protein
MKARVKATGNIVDVEWYGHNSMGTIYADVTLTTKYYEYELDFDTVYDYWTRLEHQYAGMAMQGILANYGVEPLPDDAAHDAYNYAHALVEKMKQEREG